MNPKHLFAMVILFGIVFLPMTSSGEPSRESAAVTPDLVLGEDVCVGDSSSGDYTTYTGWRVKFFVIAEKFLDVNGDDEQFIRDHFNVTLYLGESRNATEMTLGESPLRWYSYQSFDTPGEIPWEIEIVNVNDTENPVAFSGQVSIIRSFELIEDVKTQWHIYEDTTFEVDLNGKLSTEVEDYYVWYGRTDEILTVREVGRLVWNVSVKANFSDQGRNFYIHLNDSYFDSLEIKFHVYIEGVNDAPAIEELNINGLGSVSAEMKTYQRHEGGENITLERDTIELEYPEGWENKIEFKIMSKDLETYYKNMEFEVVPEGSDSVEIIPFKSKHGTFAVDISESTEDEVWIRVVAMDNGVVNEIVDYDKETIPLSDEVWLLIKIRDMNEPPVIEELTFDSLEIKSTESISLTISYSDPDGDDLSANWWVNGKKITGEMNFTYDYHPDMDLWSVDSMGSEGSSREINISCMVTDGYYRSSMENVVLTVNLDTEMLIEEPPEIIEVGAQKAEVDEGETIRLTANANDPEKAMITYTWHLKDEPSRTWEGDTVEIDDLEAGGHVFVLNVSDGTSTTKDYVWVSVATPEEESGGNLLIPILIALAVLFVIIVVAAIVLFFVLKKRKGAKSESVEEGGDTEKPRKINTNPELQQMINNIQEQGAQQQQAQQMQQTPQQSQQQVAPQPQQANAQQTPQQSQQQVAPQPQQANAQQTPQQSQQQVTPQPQQANAQQTPQQSQVPKPQQNVDPQGPVQNQ